MAYVISDDLYRLRVLVSMNAQLAQSLKVISILSTGYVYRMWNMRRCMSF